MFHIQPDRIMTLNLTYVVVASRRKKIVCFVPHLAEILYMCVDKVSRRFPDSTE